MKVTGRIAAACLALVLAGCSGNGAPSATPSLAAATPTPTPSLAAATVTPTAVTPTASVTTATPSAPASAPPVAAHIEVDGLTRDYLVVTPPDVADRDPLPLLLVLHGAGQTMRDARGVTGFDVMALDPGAVVAYLQGEDSFLGKYTGWNAGATVTGVDDVAFIKALIDRMEADYPVDPNRVFILGGSNGGQMAYLAACELSSRVAAVADVIGAMLVPCHPSQPVSVIAIHGDADEIIPIDGGKVEYCPPLVECPSFAATMKRWREIDRCTGDPTVTENAKTVETSWADCEGGTAITFIKVIGKGHTWYTSDPDDRAVTWDFFMNHPRSAGTS